MLSLATKFFDTIDAFFAWVGSSVKQSTENYCAIETADSKYVLVGHDGALVSVVCIQGATALIGEEEFNKICEGLTMALRPPMSQVGHALQVYFHHDFEKIGEQLSEIYAQAKQTATQLDLNLKDLFTERETFIAKHCAKEALYFVFWTLPGVVTAEEFKQASKQKLKEIADHQIPPFLATQNINAAYKLLREPHEAFVRAALNDLRSLSIHCQLLDVRNALCAMRLSADPYFTDSNWKPVLPGDSIQVKVLKELKGDVTDLLWPNLSKQLIPRDAYNYDLKTVKIGDTLYSSVFIDLFPQEIQAFHVLFNRVLSGKIPWRVSFLLESEGLPTLRFKKMLSSVLSFSSQQNKLISDASNLLNYIRTNTDDAVVRLRVTATTWAPEHDTMLLRARTAELAKAIQGWGSCDTSDSCGDAFAGVVSSMLGVTLDSVATPTVAPLSEVVRMLPITRPCSSWQAGALLFRSPDGRVWPFQPGSREQTTWIDLVYARPGSGKSVLSSALNLALCLSGGLRRLPRVAIIDIGPSSGGLISLLREALPPEKRYQVAHHRLRMHASFSVNPFDTQLGCRLPTPADRAFLVNFLTLLATPVGAEKPYDSLSDLSGMIVNELYQKLSDANQPHPYALGIEPMVDALLEEIAFVRDVKTTWWEVVDALFSAGFTREAAFAQRHCMPLLADAASICRSDTIADLYGKVETSTGETLIEAFGRMISAAIREYPILSRVTAFDIGEAKIVALDLDEVAKSGGDTADKQTAVMYMLARYVLARHYYLTEENVGDMPEQYRDYHKIRIAEIREDPKRIVFDEFHRTSKAQAVRDQVITDMREGRKWKVQIALLSQSVDDFDSVMIEFATSVYIMDAGPSQAIEKTATIFGLNETAKLALRHRVHGPREGGATFLAQFSTKSGVNTQLLTLTLGPIELWAFSTTTEDALLRNKLYQHIGPHAARRVLAARYPSGSITKIIEERLAKQQAEDDSLIKEADKLGVVDELLQEILNDYARTLELTSSDPD